VFIQPPLSLTIQCGSTNTAQINSWLASNGGGVAQDTCSGVTYSNNFIQQTNPGFGCFTLPVIFTATDACGNSVSDTVDLILQDKVSPVFTNFSPNLTLPCDADTSTASTGFPTVSDVCFNNLNSFIVYSDSITNLPADPDTPVCPGNEIISRTFSVTDPCGNSVSQTQVITVVIARSSGPCDSSNCVCDNECCPQPKASNCEPIDCLPQSCAPSYCQTVPCSCGFNKRDVSGDYEQFSVDFVNSPIPQCEPIYIFVHDDDANDDDDGDSVAVAPPKLNNYIISGHPIPMEELEKMKNRNHIKHNNQPTKI